MQKSKYENIHKAGVVLDDDSLSFIAETLLRGMAFTEIFFNIYGDRELSLECSKKGKGIGYNRDSKAISIPTPYLNIIAGLNLSAEELKNYDTRMDLEACLIPMSYPEYFFCVGIEETIHYLQDIGHPAMKARLPSTEEAEDRFRKLSKIDKILSEPEVEARTLTDKILEANGESPIYAKYDEILKQKFPDKYNKPIL